LLLSESFDAFLKRSITIVSLGFAFILLIDLSDKYSNWYSRVKEKMADAYAAEYTSIESMMNGLLRLNDRSHTLETLIMSLSKHSSDLSEEVIHSVINQFPTGTKNINYITSKAPKYLIEAQLNLLLESHSSELPEESRMRFVEEVLTNKVKLDDTDDADKEDQSSEGGDHIDELVIEPPFLWRQFDWNHDGELQLNELAALIKTLKQDEKALSGDDEGTHPPIRERLLFIAELYSAEFENVSSENSALNPQIFIS
jgi:hypothetical protein